jgi:hypothetical protein
MKINFLYIIDQPLCLRNRQRFGINHFASTKQVTCVIDLTQMLYPATYDEFINRGGVIESSEIDYFSPKSHLDLIRILKKLNKSNYAFDLTGSSYITLLLRIFLRIKKIEVIAISSIKQPSYYFPKNRGQRILDLLAKIKKLFQPKKIFNYILYQICQERLFLVDYMVIMGASAEKKTLSKSKKIFCHTGDYNLYLSNVKSIMPDFRDSEYIVFLDEDEANHLDFLTLGYEPTVTEENYYSSLHSFFSYLEFNFKLPVVIAEHPRALYSQEQKADFYFGRSVIRGRTLELIKNSKFVISHSSTAIGMAVLFKKPILLLATREIIMDRSRFYTIEAFAQELSLQIIDADSPFTWNEIKLNFENNRYEDYINKYIKHPKSIGGISSWEIIAQSLEKGCLRKICVDEFN